MDYLWCNHNPCYRYHFDLVLQTIQITKMQFPGSDNFAFSWYVAGLEHCNYQILKCLSFVNKMIVIPQCCVGFEVALSEYFCQYTRLQSVVRNYF